MKSWIGFSQMRKVTLWVVVAVVLFGGQNLIRAQYWGNQGLVPYSYTLVNGLMDALVGVDAQLYGDTLFCSNIFGIEIYNLSGINNPAFVSRVPTPGFSTRFVKENSTLFIADWVGLSVVDVHDIQNPQLLTHVPVDSGVYGVAVKNQYLYASTNSHLLVFDVSNPAVPQLIYQWNVPNVGNIDETNVLVFNDALYLVNGLWIYAFDITTPNQPTNTWMLEFNTGGTCWGNMAIYNNQYLFVVTTLGLNVFDLTNPYQPVRVYNQLPPNSTSIYDIAIHGNYMVLNHWQGKWKIYDISTPTNPNLIYDSSGGAPGNPDPFNGPYSLGDFTANFLFILDMWQPNGNGWTVHILDVSNIASPTEISSFQSIPGRSHGVAIVQKGARDLALVAQDNSTTGYQGILRIVDVTDPYQPQPISFVDIPVRVFSVVANENYAVVRGYVISWPNWVNYLYLVDISDPLYPVIVDQMTISNNTDQNYDGMELHGDTLYVADGHRLLILTIGGGTLQQLGSVSVMSNAGVRVVRAINNEWVYTASVDKGVQLYNVSNPQLPYLYTWYDTPGATLSLYIHNNYIYATDYTSLFVLKDVNHVLIPIGQIPTQVECWDISGENNLLFVTLGNRKIEVFDISNPESPQSLGTYDTPGDPDLVKFSHKGSRIYIADRYDFGIFRAVSPFNFAPLAFHLLSPADSTQISQPQETFVWYSSFDANGDSLTYTFHLWNASWDTSLTIPDTSLIVQMSWLPDNGSYNWTVEASDGQRTVAALDTFTFETNVVGIATLGNGIPAEFELKPNYPNPFNPQTVIEFAIPRKSWVRLEVFNALDQVVATLVDEEKDAGRYRIIWEPQGLSSGFYYYRMISGDFTKTYKMLFIK